MCAYAEVIVIAEDIQSAKLCFSKAEMVRLHIYRERKGGGQLIDCLCYCQNHHYCVCRKAAIANREISEDVQLNLLTDDKQPGEIVTNDRWQTFLSMAGRR